jgi:hypothetical protein
LVDIAAITASAVASTVLDSSSPSSETSMSISRVEGVNGVDGLAVNTLGDFD